MENTKLMTPLFYNGMFNRDGRKMRAVLEKEISDGTQTYRLWRSAGKPNLDYPRAENDRYILYVEINGYLATLGMTDFTLTDNCGFEPAAKNLYGGKEKRGEWIDRLRESGGQDAVSAALAEERKEIEKYGGDPARQTAYIRSHLNERVSTYLKAKENGGQTFPDFFGALALNDLARCAELSAVYQANRKAENEARRARAAEEEKAYCAERNQLAEQAIAAALQVIRSGGVLENTDVSFYESRYRAKTCSIINCLMRRYHIDVPLRTQGWINSKLSSVKIQNGRPVSLYFFGTRNSRGSQTFSVCMDNLIRAVIAQTSDGKDAA